MKHYFVCKASEEEISDEELMELLVELLEALD